MFTSFNHLCPGFARKSLSPRKLQAAVLFPPADLSSLLLGASSMRERGRPSLAAPSTRCLPGQGLDVGSWSQAPSFTEAVGFLHSHPRAGVVKETFMSTSKQ